MLSLVKNEPEEMNLEEKNLWYFINLNPLPSRTVLNRQLLMSVFRLQKNDEDLNFYGWYQDWFKELWKIPEAYSFRQQGTMVNILRIMFSINGRKYKLEYPKIFDEQFYRDNVVGYLNKQCEMFMG